MPPNPYNKHLLTTDRFNLVKQARIAMNCIRPAQFIFSEFNEANRAN